MFRSNPRRWRKLDNAAQAFPAAAGKKDSRVFRVYCELKEPVQEQYLQEALNLTLQKYPLFQSVLRKGLFWFYLERRNLKAVVRRERKPPCSRIYISDRKCLLFEVTYFENRINLEVFHALTDGTGAFQFLKELTQRYLSLVHGLPWTEEEESETLSDQEEDSFSQYYSREKGKKEKKVSHGFRLRGTKVVQEDMEILECLIPSGELLARARKHNVTVTVYLTAVFMWAVAEEMTPRQKRKPVVIMVPVNLRKYFPSRSMTNFWGWLECGCLFYEGITFEEVLAQVSQSFSEDLTKEQVAMRMNRYVRIEKNPVLRAVPLEMKNLFLQLGTKIGSKGVTAIFSNMGIVKVSKECEPYVERFGVFASTDKMQMCACSYGEKFYLGISSKFLNTNIQRNMLEFLKHESVSVAVVENSFPEKRKQETHWVKKFFQWLTFACITVSLVSLLAAKVLTPGLYWPYFVAAGAACTWVAVAVGYSKRRNLLKNGMWQILLISLFCILWDFYTGWQGWSLDYALPVCSLTALCSMTAFVKLRHMETEEYLFYLVMASAYGCIPLILFFAGALRFPYPSVICGGISVLYLVWILIFKQKEIGQEFRKKFYI